MDAIVRARRLASYIQQIDGFLTDAKPPLTHGHIGATLADSILQAGLNYRTVVLPRILRIKDRWPRSRCLTGMASDLASCGANSFLNWTHDEKPRRLVRLVNLLSEQMIETETDLGNWLLAAENRNRVLALRGFGPKTVDYLSRLVGFDAIAVDRHVFRFVSRANVTYHDYCDVRQVVSFAADLLGIERSSLDHAIWRHMSTGRAAA